MKFLAILFILPAALLRRTRKNKRGHNSPCDQFSQDMKAYGTQLELLEGCLGLPDDCRIVVLPRLGLDYPKPELNNAVYCKPIGYVTGQYSDAIKTLTIDLKDYKGLRKLRHQ